MKKLLLVFSTMLLILSCQKQASDNLRPEIKTISSKQDGNFFKVKNNLPKTDGVLFKLKEGVDKKAFKTSMPYKYYEYFGKIDAKNTDSIINILKKNPMIEYAEPNYSVTTQDLNPNDPYYTNRTLWGMNTIGANIAWNSGNVGSSEVIVAVLDEGNQYWHCDLYNNIWTNPFDPVDGVDNDRNGFVDDIHGWNFYDASNQLYTGNDDHGTHVAGTIAGKGNNGIGVIGEAPKVKILPVKFLADAGYLEHAIMGIDYIIDLKRRHNLNIKVINNSWGGGGFVQVLLDAINRAKAADILFVCAAGNGNNNNDSNPFYPAGYNQYADNVVSVGAMDSLLTRAWFSNYGQTVDLFAPGVAIMSTLPASNHVEGSYGSYNGTSMATPHVVGAAALYFSINPDASYLQCKNALLSSVTKTATFETLCKSGGYLTVSSFTGNTSPIIPDATCGTPPPMDITPPTTGRLLSVTPMNINWAAGTVDLWGKWQPGTDAESGITETAFRLFNNGVFDYWWILVDYGTVTEFNFSGMSIGLSGGIFDVYFQAKDGWGNWSDTSNHIIIDLNTYTPDTEAPTIPTSLSVTNPTTNSLTLNWGASIDNIGVTAYKINWRAVGGLWLEKIVSSTSNVFSNLSEGTIYEFNVQATDAAGNWSGVSSTVTGSTLITPPPVGDDIPPVVNITSPQNGYQIPVKGNRNVKIAFTATDNIGVTLRQILIDGAVVATNVSSYNWNASKASPGNHTITCKAFDAAGNQTSQSVTVVKL